jgi:hypothetical protein
MNLVDICKTDDFDAIYNALNNKCMPTKECFKILLNNYKNKKEKLFDKDGLPIVIEGYWEKYVEIGFCSYEEMETKKQINDVPNLNLLIHYGYNPDKNDMIEALQNHLHFKNYTHINSLNNDDLEKIRINNVRNLIKNHNDPTSFKKIIKKYKIPIDYDLLLFCCTNQLKPSIISYIINDLKIQPTLECLIEICKAKYYKIGYDLINNYKIKPTEECLKHSSGRNNVDNRKFCAFLRSIIYKKN